MNFSHRWTQMKEIHPQISRIRADEFASSQFCEIYAFFGKRFSFVFVCVSSVAKRL